MADYQRIIDEINGVLATGGGGGPNQVTALHGEYSDAVREVNDRLRICADLLRRGNRAEAIRQSEAEPNLLEAVAMLDFPERQSWDELVVGCGFPPPADLNINSAGDLDEAYTAEQSLDGLMRRHRLLALARAPMAARINVMRNMRRAEPDNAIWEDDLREYERARLNSLHGEIESAQRRQDLSALAALDKEVRKSEWLQPPPDQLVKLVARAHTDLRRSEARKQLSQLAEKLVHAHSDFDVDRARKLRQRWGAVAAVGLSGDGDELTEAVAPAMEWLEAEDEREQQEKEYQEALADLEAGLDEGVLREDLERLYYALGQFDRDLPETLQLRVHERFRALEVSAARRNRIVLTCIVMGVLLTASAVGMLIWGQLKSGQLAKHASNLEAFLEEGNVPAAQDYLADLEKNEPDMYSSPEIQALKGRTDALLKEEEDRKARLEQHLKTAQARGVDNPTWASLLTAETELTRAREIAASEEEKGKIAALESEVDQSKRRLQQAVNDEFQAKLQGFQTKFEDLNRAEIKDLGRIDVAISEANQLRQTPRVSPALVSPLGPMVTKLESWRDAEMKKRDEVKYLRDITGSLGDADRFGEALKRYESKFSETTRAADFKRVAQHETELWKQVRAVGESLDKYRRTDITALEPEAAGEMLKELKDLGTKYDKVPQPPALKTLEGFLEALSQRVDGGGDRIDLELLPVLNDTSVAELKMVQTKGGKKYYFTKDPFKLSDSITFYSLKGFDPDDTDRVKLSTREIANPVVGNDFNWESPQKAFSSYAVGRLGQLRDANWEAIFCDILMKLNAEKNMEPVLKVQLLRRILGVACRGSYPMKQAFKGPIDALEKASLDETANWIDPDDPGGQKARQTAGRVLGGHGDFQMAAAEAARILQTFKTTSFGPQYKWVAWLQKQPAGTWSCVSPSGGLGNRPGELFILDVAPDGSRGEFRKVGTHQPGSDPVLAPATRGAVEGRAVFLVSGLSSSG